jgi:hypothetical protein
MASPNSERPAPALAGSEPLKTDRLGGTLYSKNSKWREKYKVHPAADVFPMMSDEELAELAEDIRKNGLCDPIAFYVPREMRGEKVDAELLHEVDRFQLLDGRNRMAALELLGEFENAHGTEDFADDQVKFIDSSDISTSNSKPI